MCIWFQPGSFNDEIIAKAKELEFKILDDDYIYAVLTRLGKNRSLIE